MTKYYYTDPLKAAWMAREFGLKWLHVDSVDIEAEFYSCGEVQYSKYYNMYIISKDSEHVIRYDTDDIIINDGEYMVVMDDGLATYVNLTEYYDHIPLLSISHDYEIIRRNGKHFFMPEVEII